MCDLSELKIYSSFAKMSMSEMEILDTNGESISLDDKYKAIPLDALRVSARKKLSLYLNVQSEIVNDTNGLVSDYNGLAEMVGFGFLEIKEFERQKNPTDELLTEWTNRPDLAPTIGKLWEFLVELGRLDVLQDCKNLISQCSFLQFCQVDMFVKS